MAAATIAAASGGALVGAPVASANEDFVAFRTRWREMLTGGSAADMSVPEVAAAVQQIDATTQDHLSTFNRAIGRTYLWPDLDFAGTAASQSIDMRITYERLQQLAIAYQTEGSTYANNAAVLADVIDGLDWLYQNKYNEQASDDGNWFNWEIGVPLALNACTVLLFGQLSTAQRTNYMNAVYKFTPTPSMTGANKVWKCMVVAGRAAIVEGPAKMFEARDGLTSVFAYTTSGDGFYTDGSFIQHGKHPYTGGYGTSLIGNLSRLLWLLDGSPWEVTNPNMSNVFSWITDSYEPWLFRGSMMSAVRGRNISRHSQQDHVAGHDVVRSILWISEFAPTADADHLRGLVKHTIQSDAYRDFFGYEFGSTVPGNDVATIIRAKAIADDANTTPRQPAIKTTQFARMDRTVHRQPGFAFAIAASSARIYTYESINGENLHGWYTGDGMTYLYNGDLEQYDKGFWPTVDPYRLPGTTVPVRIRTNTSGSNHLPPQQWVGGAALGTLGATGMRFQTHGAGGSGLTVSRMRLECDGQNVTASWSPNGTDYATVGQPASISDMSNLHVGVYAARGLSSAPSIDARFESFTMACANGCSGASDEFDGTTLDTQRWSLIVREDTSRYSVNNGALVLKTDYGGFDKGADSTKNVIAQPMPAGSWQAEIVLDFVPQENWQHAGIVLYQDDQNLIRIHRVKAAGGDGFAFAESRNGTGQQQITSYPKDEFPGQLGGPPSGKKSWFMLGNQIAALGAGIGSGTGEGLETIVENRKLRALSDAFRVDDVVQPTTNGWQNTFSTASWAHLSSPAAGGAIGYYFPGGAEVKALRETRTHYWGEINTNPTHHQTGQFSRHYLTMWMDHGIDPVNASYAYVLLPDRTVAQVRDYAGNPGVQVLSNRPQVQAARAGDALGVNVWEDGPVTVGGVTCEGPASLLVKEDGDRLDIAIADPTQTHDQLQLTIHRSASSVIAQAPRVQVQSLNPEIVLLIDVAGAGGSTITAAFGGVSA